MKICFGFIRYALPISALLWSAASSVSADVGKYDSLLKSTSPRSLSSIITSADSFSDIGREDEALVLYMLAASRNTDGITDSDIAAHIKANLRAGDIHYAKGNYSNSLRYYVAGLKLSEATPSHPHLAVLYKNMGNVYNMFQDFEKGKSLYLSGLTEARKVKDNETAYKLLQNLVGVSVNLNDIPAAREYYEQSLETRHEGTPESQYMDRYISALILKYEGRHEDAIRRFKGLADMSRGNKMNARYECSAYGEIGRIFNQMGIRDSAVFYLARCREVAQANSILYQYTESLKLLYTLYDEMGLHDKATELKNRYLDLKDSIYNQRQFDMAKNQQFLYEMEKTEREIAELNERQSRAALLISRQRVILFGVLAAVILALLIIYYFYRQKKKLTQSYRSLYEMHQRIVAEHRENRERQTALVRENSELRARIAAEPSARAIPKPASDEPAQDTGVSHDSKYERSTLAPAQKVLLANRIAEVMEAEMPYCSADFSLASLAALVDSNTKYVSQVINDVFKKNFSTYVNEYRVNLASERLSDIDDYGRYSMEGIGESVGFRSGATFTSVFKKITGISPSVYKRLTCEKRNLTPKTGKTILNFF